MLPPIGEKGGEKGDILKGKRGTFYLFSIKLNVPFSASPVITPAAITVTPCPIGSRISLK